MMKRAILMNWCYAWKRAWLIILINARLTFFHNIAHFQRSVIFHLTVVLRLPAKWTTCKRGAAKRVRTKGVRTKGVRTKGVRTKGVRPKGVRPKRVQTKRVWTKGVWPKLVLLWYKCETSSTIKDKDIHTLFTHTFYTHFSHTFFKQTFHTHFSHTFFTHTF